MRHSQVFTDAPDYFEVAPPVELAGYIDACWFYGPRLEAPRHDILIPEGVVDIIFNFGKPYYRQCAIEQEGDGGWISGDVVVGQRSHLFSVTWPQATHLFALRLKPETAHTFFSIPMREITNRVRPLRAMGFGALGESVHRYSFSDQTGITSHCFDFFRALVANFEKPDVRLSSMIQEIVGREGNVDIQILCEELGFNRRTIERLFTSRVGLSPKFFARTIRLHHFLCLQREQADDNLTHAAVDANYYDQSHLIRDFKQFTGESPAKFFNSPPEIYEPLLVSLLGRRRSG